MIDESRVLYRDKDLIVYNKIPGEDSQNLIGQPIGRLDKPVGGLMLLLLNTKYQEVIKSSYKKTYLAICAGTFEEDQIEGTMEDYLLHDKRKNKVFPVKSLRKGVREASLNYKILDGDTTNNQSLAIVTLNTGRTHQIRVQFASRKHPLLGDGKYGSRVKGDIALFAKKIEFIHPKTKEAMVFELSVPNIEPWSNYRNIIDD